MFQLSSTITDYRALFDQGFIDSGIESKSKTFVYDLFMKTKKRAQKFILQAIYHLTLFF